MIPLPTSTPTPATEKEEDKDDDKVNECLLENRLFVDTLITELPLRLTAIVVQCLPAAAVFFISEAAVLLHLTFPFPSLRFTTGLVPIKFWSTSSLPPLILL